MTRTEAITYAEGRLKSLRQKENNITGYITGYSHRDLMNEILFTGLALTNLQLAEYFMEQRPDEYEQLCKSFYKRSRNI